VDHAALVPRKFVPLDRFALGAGIGLVEIATGTLPLFAGLTGLFAGLTGLFRALVVAGFRYQPATLRAWAIIRTQELSSWHDAWTSASRTRSSRRPTSLVRRRIGHPDVAVRVAKPRRRKQHRHDRVPDCRLTSPTAPRVTA
jgi:hypothetical protein